MKPYYFLIMFIPLSFLAGGIVLAINHVPGWGWLIFAAVICSSVSFKDKSKKK